MGWAMIKVLRDRINFYHFFFFFFVDIVIEDARGGGSCGSLLSSFRESKLCFTPLKSFCQSGSHFLCRFSVDVLVGRLLNFGFRPIEPRPRKHMGQPKLDPFRPGFDPVELQFI